MSRSSDYKRAKEAAEKFECPYCGAKPGASCRIAFFPTLHGSRALVALNNDPTLFAKLRTGQ